MHGLRHVRSCNWVVERSNSKGEVEPVGVIESLLITKTTLSKI
jgi:hypothetical protein